MRQLSLGVRLRPASTFETFIAGGNESVVAALQLRADGVQTVPLWLWGPAGSGRTHLLQAACAAAGSAGRRAAYLPLGDASVEPAQIFGLEGLDLVCIDDVGVVGERADWQEPLFALYQGLRERDRQLVFAAATSPVAIRFPLADLASRLRAAEVWQVRPLPEAAQGDALVARAAVLGLNLPADTLMYLQRRLPRDFAALCDVLDQLDTAALAAQRALTVPFVRAVLDGAANDGPGDAR
jgi:DnaA-homolog protein